MKNTVIVCVVLFLSACVTAPTPVLTACGDKRPKMCTLEYAPVCGFSEAGHKIHTYGNACSACGDAKVLGHTQGECR